MNACFKSPLVEAVRGGKSKGGARLTPLGFKLLDLYDQLETDSLKATTNIRRRILRELR